MELRTKMRHTRTKTRTTVEEAMLWCVVHCLVVSEIILSLE